MVQKGAPHGDAGSHLQVRVEEGVERRHGHHVEDDVDEPHGRDDDRDDAGAELRGGGGGGGSVRRGSAAGPATLACPPTLAKGTRGL